jgi:hypothetical protein
VDCYSIKDLRDFIVTQFCPCWQKHRPPRHGHIGKTVSVPRYPRMAQKCAGGASGQIADVPDRVITQYRKATLSFSASYFMRAGECAHAKSCLREVMQVLECDVTERFSLSWDCEFLWRGVLYRIVRQWEGRRSTGGKYCPQLRDCCGTQYYGIGVLKSGEFTVS